MPTLALTVNQAFRYFLAGAFFLGVARWLGQPLETRLNLIGSSSPESWAVLFVLALVVGMAAYCLHRIVPNPLFLRPITLLLNWDHAKKEAAWWFPWWPLKIEADLTARRATEKDTANDLGWSGEIHFLYMAVELFFFALWIWPGAPIRNRGLYSTFAAVALVGTWLWSLTAAKAEASIHRLSHVK